MKGWQEMTDRSPRLEASGCQSKHSEIPDSPCQDFDKLTPGRTLCENLGELSHLGLFTFFSRFCTCALYQNWNKLKHWQMRLFWVIFKHCARRRRRRLGIWKIWRWLSDGHWDAHCVLPSPFVLFLFPTSIFLLFFFARRNHWAIVVHYGWWSSQSSWWELLLPFRDEIWKVWRRKRGCWPKRKMMLRSNTVFGNFKKKYAHSQC